MRMRWGYSLIVLVAGCSTGSSPVAKFPTPAPVPPATRPATLPGSANSAPVPTPGQTYIIRPGDSLWQIAKAAYGDGTKYERIIAANPGLDPERLKIGHKIVIPILK